MRPNRALRWTGLLALGALLLGGADPSDPTPRARVGAYYFDGWTGKTFHITERLKTEFAHREPVWGWRDDSPDVMRQQIDLAADHDIRFFAFCWYWPEGPDKTVPMNQALELYLKAPNRDRLNFCLLVANHGGYRVGPKDWDAVSARWVELMKEPTHERVGGKPLLIFFSPNELLKSFGGADAVRSALDGLRERARAAGLPGVAVAACATPGPENGWNDLDALERAGFDLFTGYNYPGAGRKGPELKRPFAELSEGSEAIWEQFARKSPRPYMPVVTAGWDKRPWEAVDGPAEKHAVYYEDRTPEAVRDVMARAVGWLDRHPDRTPAERIVLVYAWNENGEGGYLTPTRKDGNAWLEAVRDGVR